MQLSQVLNIEPANELVFRGPFTDVVKCYLSLGNPSDSRVCYKIKTTVPKQYCVRPTSGILEPGSHQLVQIMLQPFDLTNTPQSELLKHKFLVQSAFVPQEEPTPADLSVLWQTLPRSALMDSKLRVVFEQKSASESQAKKTEVPSPNKNQQQQQAAGAQHDDNGGAGSGKYLASEDDETNKAHEPEWWEKFEAVSNLRKENSILKLRLVALENGEENSALAANRESSVALVQVIMIAVAALLVGLIFGKLF